MKCKKWKRFGALPFNGFWDTYFPTCDEVVEVKPFIDEVGIFVFQNHMTENMRTLFELSKLLLIMSDFCLA